MPSMLLAKQYITLANMADASIEHVPYRNQRPKWLSQLMLVVHVLLPDRHSVLTEFVLSRDGSGDEPARAVAEQYLVGGELARFYLSRNARTTRRASL